MKIVQILSALSVLAPLLAGLSIRDRLWLYVLISAVCDILPFSPALYTHRHYYGNLFLLCEFWLICSLFVKELCPRSGQQMMNTAILTIAVAFVVHCAFFHWSETNYQGGALLYGLMIPLPILGFYRIIRSNQPLQILEDPFFIFCAGFLVYTAGNFLVMMYQNPLGHSINPADKTLARNLWYIHNVLNIVKNVAIYYHFRLRIIKRRPE